jgi:hypothetical protein
MNIFNKVVAILLLLVLIPIVTIALIVPHESAQVLANYFTDLESQLSSSYTALNLALRIIIAVVIDALLVLLLYLEVRRRAVRAVPLQEMTGGEALLSLESIIERLKYRVDVLPGVLDVEPRIRPRRGAVEVTLNVEMAASAEMQADAETISDVARRVVEEEMGIKMRGKPRLQIHTVAFPGADRASKAPETGPEFVQRPVEKPASEDETTRQEEPISEAEATQQDRPAQETDVIEIDQADEREASNTP